MTLQSDVLLSKLTVTHKLFGICRSVGTIRVRCVRGQMTGEGHQKIEFPRINYSARGTRPGEGGKEDMNAGILWGRGGSVS